MVNKDYHNIHTDRNFVAETTDTYRNAVIQRLHIVTINSTQT